MDRDVLQRALDDDGFSDYEDAVAHEAAHAAGVNAIVTRNGRDFAKATIPVFEPRELLAAIAARPRTDPSEGSASADHGRRAFSGRG